MDKFLIKNTTRAEREKIVKDSLGYSDIGCDDCVNGFDMYQPYIDGKKEISEITESYKASFISDSRDNYAGSGYKIK